ncbi:MAG: PBSX family phage terminase large subunit [Thiotrichales bacterium]
MGASLKLVGFEKENWCKDVLDCYRPLYEDEDFDIELLWGGRDSGKTHAIVQKLVYDCIHQPYFRCVMVRKTYESIKDSQYQKIKDFVYDYDLESLFEFKVSPLEITFKPNGNKFIARGCDKSEKLKSLADPSCAWYEEGNQIEEKDYITISTTLRTEKAKVKEYFSFNPESRGEFEDFWVYTRFFEGQESNAFHREIRQEIEHQGEKKQVVLRIRSIHTTYHDNRFATPERIARHEDLRRTNPHYYRVFCLGLWGNEENDSPYFAAFDRSKHVGKELLIDPSHELWLSFDFNLDPCTVVIGQKIPFVGLRVLDCMQNSDGTEALCHDFMAVPEYVGHPHNLKVTGDNSGYSGSSVGGKNSAGETINDFHVILETFKLYRVEFGKRNFVRPNKVNRTHKLSRDLCNAVYRAGIVEFDDELCSALIKEIEKAIPDPKTEKLFKDRTKGYQMDRVDAKRYLFNAWFPKQMKSLNEFVRQIRMAA